MNYLLICKHISTPHFLLYVQFTHRIRLTIILSSVLSSTQNHRIVQNTLPNCYYCSIDDHVNWCLSWWASFVISRSLLPLKYTRLELYSNPPNVVGGVTICWLTDPKTPFLTQNNCCPSKLVFFFFLALSLDQCVPQAPHTPHTEYAYYAIINLELTALHRSAKG